MYDLQPTAEQIEFRDTVRELVEQEIRPLAIKSQRLEALARLPDEVADKASQMGLRALALSEDAGGAGADALTCCIVAEELAAGDADLAAVLMHTASLAPLFFDRWMNEAQRDRYLPAFMSDDRYHLAVAIDEPGDDNDLGIHYHRPDLPARTVRCQARPAPDGGWIVDGIKSAVDNAPVARLFAVEVACPEGIAALLIPSDAPGLTVREPEDEHRWHGRRGDVVLENCRVPARNLLGAQGASPLADARGNGRGTPWIAAMNLGVGRAAYEAAVDYAKLRVQGGRPIIEHQSIGTLLADCAIRMETARSAVWRAAWAADHPDAAGDGLPLENLARACTAEAVHRVAIDAAECFGAMGVMRDMPQQKYVHDAAVFLGVAGGPAEAKLRLAEAISGYRRGAR